MKIFEKIKEKFPHLKDDLIAGLIVAIVALPIAIGFSIASGVDPAMGVYAAIIGGFLAALFGGSDFQVSGPTGAMVVVVLSVGSQYGVQGLIGATLLAGIILLLLSIFKLGKAIEYIPHPVIVGFTAGIAVLIFFGQLNNFMGISIKYPTDAGFLTKTYMSLASYSIANIYTILLALITIFLLIYTPKVNKKIPGSIIAVAFGLIVFTLFGGMMGLKTVGDVGLVPSSLPMPSWPGIDFALIFKLLPAALTIAALAAIESLLSAVVADGMTGKKHDPNKELRGQGIANIGSALFGGLPVTGAIARTATNVRNGGKTKFAGIIHAVFLLIIIVALGFLFANIPLAVIAGILMFVAFNMVEWDLVFEIFRTPASDVAVMIITFLLTVLVDLTVAIEIGIILASILFMKRMADMYKIDEVNSSNEDDKTSKFVQSFNHKDVSIYTMNGPLFFGAAAKLDQILSETPGGHKPIKIIRMKYVSAIDATGMVALRSTVKRHKKLGGVVILSTVQPNVHRTMKSSGLVDEIQEKHIFKRTSDAMVHALMHAHRLHKEPETVTPEEIAKYNLKDIEADDNHVTHLEDKDPIEDFIKSTGIHHVHHATIQAGTHVNKAVRNAKNVHDERVRETKKGLVEMNPFKSRKLEK